MLNEASSIVDNSALDCESLNHAITTLSRRIIRCSACLVSLKIASLPFKNMAFVGVDTRKQEHVA
jgi:hypothetical protein